MYNQIRESLVEVICYSPPLIRRPERKIHSVVTGITLVAGDNYCCIVALKTGLFPPDGLEVFHYEVVFPDNTIRELQREEICTVGTGDLAVFAFHTTEKLVEPVKFSTDKVSRTDAVSVAGFKLPLSIPFHVANGYVMQEGIDRFNHDCPHFKYTCSGEPVFNAKCELIGICCENYGLIRAMTVSCITEHLSRFLPDGVENMDLTQICSFYESLIE